ncbi:hypothetical protein [Patulibacter defluvii]|uniref:hypothetical protein n=1 Tax=Patulibacter defluvii TaxID=3095358 RepID=UPI002A75B0B9|nr:hypothetical protein [Patulibacter sp. DM4]
MQCAAGAMTAVAGASGARMWLETKLPVLLRPRVRTAVRRTVLGLGVLAAGVLGPSAHAPGDAAGGRATAAAPPAVVAPAPPGR